MSLINSIKQEFKQKHPEIYRITDRDYEKVINSIYQLNFIKIFLFLLSLAIFVLLYSYFIDFKFLQIFKINFDDNIKTFSTAIITLVSMNLFVTNLLLTHLKDERDDIQIIIDKRVNFKFVTYLGFSIIITILFLYFISPNIENKAIKSNVLILIFSAFIFYIFQLINLYNTVFNFIHKSQRNKIIRKELEKEFKLAFYNNYLRKKFNMRLSSFFLVENNFTEHNPYNLTAELEPIKIKTGKNLYLNDVKMTSLKKELTKIKSGEKKFVSLSLDQEFEKNKEYEILFFDKNGINNNRRNKKITDKFILNKNKILPDEIDKSNLNRLLLKINNETLNNKFVDLKYNLEYLDEIYEKYVNLKS